MKNCKKLAVNIGNRKEAIKTAIKELGTNEILLVAGKGHEKIQDYGNRILNFSDKKVIKEIIKKRKSFTDKNYWSSFIAQKSFRNNKLKNINYNGVSINTKSIKKNNLFFAIKGKNTDGHKFVNEAIRKGANKCVVSRKIKHVSKDKIIKVKILFLP